MAGANKRGGGRNDRLKTETHLQIDQSVLGARLRESREYVGLSQEEVSTSLGIRRPSIGEMEIGTRRVTAIELKKIANLYGRSVDALLGSEDAYKDGTEVPDFLARALDGLDPDDCAEVARFAEFLKNSPSKRKGS